VTRNRKGRPSKAYVLQIGVDGCPSGSASQIQRVDAAGSVVGSSTIWVQGDVPMDARRVLQRLGPEAASYRVTVVSYDWACQGGGSGM